MKFPKVILLWLSLVLLTACTQVQPAVAPAGRGANQELVVFAAASLTEAFDELGTQYRAAHPDGKITFNYAGSQQLAQQLTGGAPADVFASANQKQMQVAVDGGRIAPDTARPFAHNRLVVILPADNPAGISTLVDLAKPGVKLVLADAAVPVGQYSLDFLTKTAALPEYTATFSQTVLANVVSYEDNVRAVLTKVQLGEADAGIVYTSDITGAARDNVVRLEIPDVLNVVATYPIAAVSDSTKPELAAEFVDLVLSPAGQQVLETYGFIPISSQ
ncbi:MAG: molybdate ABC transporter substrate-binding protein [Anaerolineales bacterium]|nr:molybdate ABC transporter substrate-binding protein [Anaerolineales bacterium]